MLPRSLTGECFLMLSQGPVHCDFGKSVLAYVVLFCLLIGDSLLPVCSVCFFFQISKGCHVAVPLQHVLTYNTVPPSHRAVSPSASLSVVHKSRLDNSVSPSHSQLCSRANDCRADGTSRQGISESDSPSHLSLRRNRSMPRDALEQSSALPAHACARADSPFGEITSRPFQQTANTVQALEIRAGLGHGGCSGCVRESVDPEIVAGACKLSAAVCLAQESVRETRYPEDSVGESVVRACEEPVAVPLGLCKGDSQAPSDIEDSAGACVVHGAVSLARDAPCSGTPLMMLSPSITPEVDGFAGGTHTPIRRTPLGQVQETFVGITPRSRARVKGDTVAVEIARSPPRAIFGQNL